MDDLEMIEDIKYQQHAGAYDLFVRVEERLLAQLNVDKGKYGKFGEGRRSALRDALLILEREMNR